MTFFVLAATVANAQQQPVGAPSGVGAPDASLLEHLHDYFPLRPGAQWNYTMTPVDKGEPFTRTLTVKKVESDDGVFRYTVAKWDASSQGNMYLLSDSSGLYMEAMDEDLFFGMALRVRFMPRLLLLNAPLRPGLRQVVDTMVRTPFRRRNMRVESEVMREEKVATGAGEFNAMLVHVKRTWANNESAEIYVWFAPGTGLVKFMSSKHTGVLESFNIGRFSEETPEKGKKASVGARRWGRGASNKR